MYSTNENKRQVLYKRNLENIKNSKNVEGEIKGDQAETSNKFNF